jgi:UDP-glucose 4-epimerase
MKAFITGGAGFIGSNLTDRLLQEGNSVTIFDNFSTGQCRFLKRAKSFKQFQLVKGDLLDEETLNEAIDGHDIVFHLAANADVRFGTLHPRKDLEQNTIATFNVLEAMRAKGITNIAFSSTGSIYGEHKLIPTPEIAPMPVQTSLYGASKLACEGLIEAYCEGYGFKSWIFRYVSIVGERYSHGHIFDFYKKLKSDPTSLHVLGNGKQRKSYLYIQDCIDSMLVAIEKAQGKVNIFNLGVDENCEVNDSVRWISEHLEVNPRISYEGGERGWIGDSPLIFLDCSSIRNLGWKPKLTIQEGVIKTVKFLQDNNWLIEGRA